MDDVDGVRFVLDNMLSWIVFNSVSSLKETVGG
jgi:hypothetical protein